MNRNRIIQGMFIVNVVTAIMTFMLASASQFPDAEGYRLMADSIGEGKFSSWYRLDSYYPETLRIWGYPAFVYFCSLFSDSDMFVKVAQFLGYVASFILGYRIVIQLSNNSDIAKIVYLLLTAVNIQIVYYSGIVSADSLTILFIAVYVYTVVFYSDRGYLFAVYLGLLSGIICQFRPDFLLFPFFLIFGCLLFYRHYFKYAVVHLLVFFLVLVPFGIWNYHNHGVFKVTPIEGGAGVAHLGYWQFKLPQGHLTEYYWHNRIGYDPIEKAFFDREGAAEQERRYDKEWGWILTSLRQFETDADRENLALMKNTAPSMAYFVVHNSAYTLEREKLLWNATIRNVIEDPVYYVKSRIYAFCRNWFTGINEKKLSQCTTTVSCLKLVYPFLVTFFSIFIGLIFASFVIFRHKLYKDKSIAVIYMLVLYYGLCHVPFTIMARYTVPVHLFVIVLIAVSLSTILLKAGGGKVCDDK